MKLKEPEDSSSEEVIDQVIDLVESGLDDGHSKEGRALFITLTLTTVSLDIFSSFDDSLPPVHLVCSEDCEYQHENHH